MRAQTVRSLMSRLGSRVRAVVAGGLRGSSGAARLGRGLRRQRSNVEPEVDQLLEWQLQEGCITALARVIESERPLSECCVAAAAW